MTWAQIQPFATALLRHGLTALAGMMVTWGLLPSTSSDQFVTIALGIALGLGSVAWSWWQKRHQVAVVQTAHVTSFNAGVIAGLQSNAVAAAQTPGAS